MIVMIRLINFIILFIIGLKIINTQSNNLNNFEEFKYYLEDCFKDYKSPLKGAGEWQKPNIPLLLIPGIGGSIFHIDESTPKKLWIQYDNLDNMCNEYMSTIFDNNNKSIQSRFGYDHVVTVRNDYYGLCPIENIASNFPGVQYNYYKELIIWATSLGYIPGETLFGFPYDWRQSIQYRPTLDKLIRLIESMAQKSPENKIDIITHSSGGLLLKYLLGTDDHIRSYIRIWIPIATPWIGSGALLFKALITGYDLGIPHYPGVGGLSEKTAHQLEMGWPSIFELLPDLTAHDQWGELPSITFNLKGKTEKTSSEQSLFNFLRQVNKNNEFRNINNISYPQPFDVNIWSFTRETRKHLKNFEKLGETFNIHNIVGNNVKTKYSIIFTDNVDKLTDIKNSSYTYDERNGDGLVPVSSASAHGMKAQIYFYNGNADHLQMLESKVILHSVRHFLGLSCELEGEWTFTSQNEPSLPSQFKLNFKHSKKVNPIENLLNKTSDTIDLEYRGLKGVATLDSSCLTMSGNLGIGKIVGRRTIGTECFPHEKKEILTNNGRYIYKCTYGFWSSKATLKCDNGFKEKNDSCIHEGKDETSVLTLVIIVGIIGTNILVILGYLKLRNMRRSYFRVL